MTPSISYKNIYANSPNEPAVIPTQTKNPNSKSSLYGLRKKELRDISTKVDGYNSYEQKYLGHW